MVSPEFYTQFPPLLHSTHVELSYAGYPETGFLLSPPFSNQNDLCFESCVVYVNMIDTLLGDHENPSAVDLSAPGTKD